MVKIQNVIQVLFIGFILLSFGCSKQENVLQKDSVTESESIGDRLIITKFNPGLPASIPIGEKLIVTVEYNINSVDEARIFVRPYTNKRRTSGYRAHGCRPLIRGQGVIEGYFIFDKPTKVDEVRVNMVNAKDKSYICTSISKEISAQWIIPEFKSR